MDSTKGLDNVKRFGKLTAFGCQCEILVTSAGLTHKPIFGRSVMRCREARAALVGGISRLNGLFLAHPNRLCHLRAPCGERHDPDKTGANHSVGRCSSPVPVSRLQATREPLKGDDRREFGRNAWLRGTGQTRTCADCTGKAFAFTKEQYPCPLPCESNTAPTQKSGLFL